MPPIAYNPDIAQADTAGQLHSGNNTTTVRTSVPGRSTTGPATGFPLKLEQIQNVNTKNGISDKSILIYNKLLGMWEPVDYVPGLPPVISGHYEFVDSLEWIVIHNKNTTAFRETLVKADGTKFAAKVRIIDSNSFVVQLTSAESGWVDVIFM